MPFTQPLSKITFADRVVGLEMRVQWKASEIRWRRIHKLSAGQGPDQAQAIVEYITSQQAADVAVPLDGVTLLAAVGWRWGEFLKAGDVVELEVESIGVLRNKVVKG